MAETKIRPKRVPETTTSCVRLKNVDIFFRDLS